ncbi:MAG: LL-diaminopimelate aminotransferase [Dehalococcoidia bacterium]|nr:LL-diaminopimelate aminotransferase [Dehalococcoidia bacterium]MCA9850164.1 LL-diaminopimelate aminotransferase [Dehalococcoidia bacterium]MCA9856389.1 LL-diaminopimelate aminotransferase [Dehalococcoidia bacterium]MCB9484007.1 LL-diaminopimelate aminotransferase [Dehalococcoidia bacterium]MCB9490466.1 LL-diaminopimelate aminotransferase [Dehalococcoidia bacterium]
MELAQRVQQLPPYLFARISQLIAEKRAAGVDVISLGIGDPDLPTPPHILDALKAATDVPANHRYPESDGLPEFRRSIANWYQKRHGVTLDPDREVVPLIGSKEGIAHFPLCLINPGDVSLITDPGYPVYEVATMFAGGETVKLPLSEEDGWLPRLDEIPADVAARAKILWLNYPNNPTGAIADLAFFEKAVAWAKAHDVAIAHDLAYADVSYDGYRPQSILEVDGARDVAIEFNSLSKAFNMTGWRVGMAVGNAELINALTRVKTNMDSGIPQAIQAMAMAALDGPLDSVEEHNAIYTRRRDRAIEVLRELGLRVEPPKASLYIWARLPEGERSSADFAGRLIDQTGVVVTPGMSYGEAGEGYIRISLTTPDDRLNEALDRLAKFARGEQVL